ncbi:Aste57867_9589 [Aphanomyces stellatus]|uniref:Aste57867_9589 protein n=1 Tax=Aphanomyces stellatus TaxID=120398 RepID=A0A485KN62_9STRA|nr:hypothetical protein As57867_009551 [Aphanomyces stellatus]VFT86468.1 Aste57867_9589 [Aphanomyces stellatus]
MAASSAQHMTSTPIFPPGPTPTATPSAAMDAAGNELRRGSSLINKAMGSILGTLAVVCIAICVLVWLWRVRKHYCCGPRPTHRLAPSFVEMGHDYASETEVMSDYVK